MPTRASPDSSPKPRSDPTPSTRLRRCSPEVGEKSSVGSGVGQEDLDFASVQRGNPEMQRRAQEVIDRCWQMGDDNPILLIHDVGAGGLSNAVPEAVDHSHHGAQIELREVDNAEPGMSPMEIWCNEAQERYVLVIDAAGAVELRAWRDLAGLPAEVVQVYERVRGARGSSVVAAVRDGEATRREAQVLCRLPQGRRTLSVVASALLGDGRRRAAPEPGCSG